MSNYIGKFIDTGKGTSLLCLYNHKMIDTDNIEDYLKEIERESQELNVKLKHYTESLDEAQKDSTKAYDFRFERVYLHNLETQLYAVDKKLEGLQLNIETLEQESEENEKSIRKIFAEIIDKNRLVDAADKNISMFKEYIEANAEYQDNIKKYNQCNIELKKLKRELEEIKTHIGQAIEAKHKYDTEQKGLIG